MNKKMLTLLGTIENKRNEMKDLLNKKDLDGAEALKVELENLNRELSLEKSLYESDLENAKNNGVTVEPENKKNPVGEFLNAVRGREFDNTMVQGNNAAGGYTVPEDIKTQINQFLQSQDSLTPLVRVSQVTTKSGARTFQRRAFSSGLVAVDELDNIASQSTPQFQRIEYTIKKYAGRYIASNELLEDTDANIRQTMIDWIGNASRVTRNRKILEVARLGMSATINNLDNLKSVINTTLDPAFRGTAKVITNVFGFHWLDTLKDENGRYLLQDSIVFNSRKQLFGMEVVVLSQSDLPNDSQFARVPIIIGDLKEGIELFDRNALAIRSSDVAGNAWGSDSTEWRAIERLDVVLRDHEAFVFAGIPYGVAFAGLGASVPVEFTAEAPMEGVSAAVEAVTATAEVKEEAKGTAKKAGK